MILEKFYKGESLRLQVDLTDAAGEPIAITELEDVEVLLQVNKKDVATLIIDEGIEPGEEANQLVLTVSAAETANWNTGRLTANFSLVIDGETTIEQVILYDVHNP